MQVIYPSLKDMRWAFYQMLFDEGDKVAFGEDDRTAYKAVDPFPGFFVSNAVKFCINPLREVRNTDNVTKINSLLFEVDWDSEGSIVSKDQQIAMFKESGLPYASLVFSGKKSVHAIVRFQEPIEKEWQKSWWKAIEQALTKHGMLIDDKTKAIPQLSRLPGSLRPETGLTQDLIELGHRTTQQEVKAWLKANDVELKDPTPQVPNTYVSGTNNHYSDSAKFKIAIKWQTKSKGEYKSYAKSGNHDWLFKFGITCWTLDLSLDATLFFLNQEFPSTYNTSAAGPQSVAKAVKSGWTWAKNQNIPQKELL